MLFILTDKKKPPKYNALIYFHLIDLSFECLYLYLHTDVYLFEINIDRRYKTIICAFCQEYETYMEKPCKHVN